MPHSLGNIIGDSLERSLNYAETLLTGVTPERFARFATPGGQTVESNHPAFVFGHLALYPERIVGNVGGDASAVAAPEGFDPVFSRTATCQDDPEGGLYPAMDEVLAAFRDGYAKALEALRAAPDEVFAAPNPVEEMIPRFPTVGSVNAFYCSGHVMVHLGQLSAWRRMEGLGSA